MFLDARMSYHIIRSMEDIDEGVRVLTEQCVLMKDAVAIAGAPPLRRRENSFAALARIITGQLLSVAAAGTIWGRVEQLSISIDPSGVLKLAHEELCQTGLSSAKARTLKALAAAIDAGRVDLAGFEEASEDDVRNTLMGVKGIGPWTVDIYVMLCLGRADSFAPGDRGLRNAAGLLQGREQSPTARELEQFAQQNWRPWRGVAARLLWHYYAVAKNAKTNPLDT
jgi:DNA-3-methyladenine glycosylase II